MTPPGRYLLRSRRRPEAASRSPSARNGAAWRSRLLQTSPLSRQAETRLSPSPSTILAMLPSSDSSSDSHSPVAALQASLQVQPDTRPQRLLVNVFPDFTPNAYTLCMHLRSENHVEWHHCDSCSLKRSGFEGDQGEDEDKERRPAKRARTTIQLPTSRTRSGLEIKAFTPLNLRDRAECNNVGFGTEGSLVDVGLVKLFSASTDEPSPASGTGLPSRPKLHPRSVLNHVPSSNNPRKRKYHVAFSRPSIYSAVIIILTAMATILIVIFVHGFNRHDSHQPPMPINYTIVDWNQRTINLELGLSSIPRIILFGEVANEPKAWMASPGLRPINGPHHKRTIFVDRYLDVKPIVPDNWFSNHTDFPHYKPWETTSAGVYVPTFRFLYELDCVLRTICTDLQLFANHGPPDFLFTAGDSTQFRWNTSGFSFLTPDVDLPTVPIESFYLNRTAFNIPPSTPGVPSPAPTARPPTPREITNLDPNLVALCAECTNELVKLIVDDEEGSLSSYYHQIGLGRAQVIAQTLGELHLRLLTGKEEWGSDQDRLDWILSQRQFSVEEVTHLDEYEDELSKTVTSVPATTRFMPTDTAFPSELFPEELMQVWRSYTSAQAMKSRRGDPQEPEKTQESEASQQTEQSPRVEETLSPLTITAPYKARLHTNSGAATTGDNANTIYPSKVPLEAEFIDMQRNNRTASIILEILESITHRPLNNTRNASKTDPTYGEIINYADRLERLYDHVASIRDRITQVLEGVNFEDLEKVGYFKAETKRALRRLRDTKSFINEIALPRIADTSNRAGRGADMLKSLQHDQASLRHDITQGWSNGTHRFHLPALWDMAEEYAVARRWMHAEAEDVWTLWQARQEELRSHERYADPYIVWSRWGSRDCRCDPGGRNAFWWDKEKEFDGEEHGKRWWWEKDGVDSSGRHGCRGRR